MSLIIITLYVLDRDGDKKQKVKSRSSKHWNIIPYKEKIIKIQPLRLLTTPVYICMNVYLRISYLSYEHTRMPTRWWPPLHRPGHLVLQGWGSPYFFQLRRYQLCHNRLFSLRTCLCIYVCFCKVHLHLQSRDFHGEKHKHG